MHTISESNIEEAICLFLESQGISIEKVSSEGFWNEKRWIYQKRRSKYSKSWTSDLHGTIAPSGRGLYIEVKKKSEMKFFDRPTHELEKSLIVATYDKWLSKSSIKRYAHAVEQARYIEDKLKHWAVAFYASSIDEVKWKLKNFWIEVT